MIYIYIYTYTYIFIFLNKYKYQMYIYEDRTQLRFLQHPLLTREVFINRCKVFGYFSILNNSHKRNRIGNPSVIANIVHSKALTNNFISHKIRAKCWRGQWRTNTLFTVSKGTYPPRCSLSMTFWDNSCLGFPALKEYRSSCLLLSWCPTHPQRASDAK